MAKNPIQWFLIGKSPEAHRLIGKTIGSGGDMSDPDLLSEGLKTEDGTYDAWHADHITQDQRSQILKAGRKRRLPIHLYRKAPNALPVRWDKDKDEAAERRKTLDAHPGRQKALDRLKELKQKREGDKPGRRKRGAFVAGLKHVLGGKR